MKNKLTFKFALIQKLKETIIEAFEYLFFYLARRIINFALLKAPQLLSIIIKRTLLSSTRLPIKIKIQLIIAMKILSHMKIELSWGIIHRLGGATDVGETLRDNYKELDRAFAHISNDKEAALMDLEGYQQHIFAEYLLGLAPRLAKDNPLAAQALQTLHKPLTLIRIPMLMASTITGRNIPRRIIMSYLYNQSLNIKASIIENELKNAKNNEAVAFGSGFTGHAIIIQLKRDIEDNIILILYNSGGGTHFHHKDTESGKFASGFGYKIPKSALSAPGSIHKLLIALLDLERTSCAEKYYEGLKTIIRNLHVSEDVITPTNYGIPLINGQYSGTCTWKSIMAFTKSSMEYNQYLLLKFEIKLDTLSAYYEQGKLRAVNQEIVKEQLTYACDNLERLIGKLEERQLADILKINSQTRINSGKEKIAEIRFWLGENKFQEKSYQLEFSRRIIAGKWELVRNQLNACKDKFNINTTLKDKFFKGYSVLLFAAREEKWDIVAKLLEEYKNNIDVNVTAKDEFYEGYSVLLFAAYHKKWDIVAKLLEEYKNNMDINVTVKASLYKGYSVLLFAAYHKKWDIVAKLLEEYKNNIDVNVTAKDEFYEGYSVLLFAAYHKKWDIVVKLLEEYKNNIDVNVTAKDKFCEGYSVLLFAAREEKWDIVAKLLEEYKNNMDLNVTVKASLYKGYSVLLFAAYHKKWDIVAKLLEEYKNNIDVNVTAKDEFYEGYSVLLFAAYHKKWDIVVKLLEEYKNNIDVNVTAKDKFCEGYSVLLFAAREEKWDIVVKLLEEYKNNIDVNVTAKDKFCEGYSVLLFAARHWKWDIVVKLLEEYKNNIDVNVTAKYGPFEGYSVLLFAARYGKWDIVAKLLEEYKNNIDVNVTVKDGRYKGYSVLKFAIEAGEEKIINKLNNMSENINAAYNSQRPKSKL